jgi:hypothetical protein
MIERWEDDGGFVPETDEVRLREQDLVERLLIRARIRRADRSRKSVQEGKRDRIADLLEEAAQEIERLRNAKA